MEISMMAVLVIGIIAVITLLLSKEKKRKSGNQSETAEDQTDRLDYFKNEHEKANRRSIKMILHLLASVVFFVFAVVFAMHVEKSKITVFFALGAIGYFVISCIMVLYASFSKADLILSMRNENIEHRDLK